MISAGVALLFILLFSLCFCYFDVAELNVLLLLMNSVVYIARRWYKLTSLKVILTSPVERFIREPISLYLINSSTHAGQTHGR